MCWCSGAANSHESTGRMSSALPSSSLQMGKAKYTVTLWPEPVGTGRPGPLALARPRELFWGTFIDGTWVPSWTQAAAGLGWLCSCMFCTAVGQPSSMSCPHPRPRVQPELAGSRKGRGPYWSGGILGVTWIIVYQNSGS